MLPTGTIHKDLTGEASGFRSIMVYIINDSIIPVTLKITFPNDYINLRSAAKDSLEEFFHQDTANVKVHPKYKVFLLPETLPDDKLYQESSLPTEELELFLNKELYAYTTLTKVIKPKETYRLRLGFLIHPDGRTRAALFSKGHKCNLSIPDQEIKSDSINKNGIDLMLGVILYSDYSIIPCGQLFYSKSP